MLFFVSNMNVELMKRSSYGGGGRVGSDFLSIIAGRVNVSLGRVGSERVTRRQLGVAISLTTAVIH